MQEAIQRMKKYFDRYISTDQQHWQRLIPYLEKSHIPNRTTIKQAGESEQYLRFILKGGAAILINHKGKTLCLDMCMEDEFLCDFKSLNNGRPTDLFIKNFESMDVVMIERKHLVKIYASSLLGARMGKVLAERQTIRGQRHYIENHLGKNTEARYMELQRTRRNMMLRAPLNYVASYLGVSPGTLSRLRKNLS